jgi:Leucine-rich repeat (LRR) protein
MKRIFAFLLVLFVVGSSSAVPVTFNDPNLRITVMAQHVPPIDPNDANRPDANDMLGLTRLDANSLGITDLTGLQTATNLTTLYLCNDNLSDLSLLSGLTKMKYLRLWQNPNLTNLSPLANMNSLLSFWAHDCNIADINFASNFTQLQSLHLGHNVISDINPLSGLTNLTYLNLNSNKISEINPLSGLTKLIYLYLSYNENVSCLNALVDMSSLVELGLTDVNLSDISYLANVYKIKYLWLGYNQIEDISPLTGDANLITLNLSYNPLSFESWCVHLKTIINNKPSATIFSNVFLNDRFTDVNDMQIFASKWLRQDCSLANGDCSGADFGEDGNVDFYDFAIFAEWWMYNK